MPKIIFLEAVQNFGGARKSTVELAARLAQSNDVEIIDMYGTCVPFLQACDDAGLNLTVIDKRSSPFMISSGNKWKLLFNYIYFIFHILKINRRLVNHICENDESIIVVNNSKVLSFLLRKPKNSKVVFFARGWFVSQQISKLDRLLYRKLVDKFIAVSEATRYALYSAGIASLENIDVVHNAIRVKDVPKTALTDKVRILVAGGFLPAKGHMVILAVAQELIKCGIDFELVIAGIVYKGELSTKFYSEVCDFIKSNDLDGKVRLVVDSNNIEELFKWCDIFCHASDTEGLPRVVMEAMSYGKPVIANAVGGVTDYILHGYTGFITRHNNISDYVRYIKLLIDDRELYNKISGRSWDLISETYTSAAQIEKLHRVLTK